MEIALFGSGSTGNAALVTAGHGDSRVRVLLDCGLAQRTARNFARDCGADLTRIDAVLLTHHHSDHSANVVGVAARAKAPLYAHPDALENSPRTAERERARRRIEDRPYRADEAFEIGPLRCLPVHVPHDAEPTHGFVFEADGQRVGFFTDLGTTETLTSTRLGDLDGLVLEFNHDVEMLRNSPYPFVLQRRVGGDLGHLNNDQAGGWLADAAPQTLQRLVLAHLSQKNNTPELALAAAQGGLAARGLTAVDVQVAPARGITRLAFDQPARC